MPNHKVQTKRRSTGRKKLYILVMGLAGVGKSTFISIATENEDIPIGSASDLDGGTQIFSVCIFCY